MSNLNTNHIIAESFFKLRNSGKIPVTQRKELLSKLRRWIHQNRSDIHIAMDTDFKKPATEVDGTELFHVLNEIKFALQNIDLWTEPLKVDAPLTMIGTRSYIQYEPRGVCLIIAPWNYPFSLCIGPLVSAIAAGNKVVIKPSELTVHVSSLIKKLVTEIFDDGVAIVFEGDAEVSKRLLTLPFDHVFFTGSPAIGKSIMQAAAAHLTSVTLELGGKSPTIITASANIKDAAQRIVVGKFVNNGQTCIAPDYILIDKKIAESFTNELIIQLKSHFAENGSFQNSVSYARIINEKHFTRLENLLNDALTRGATLRFGGTNDLSIKFFHPAILTDVPANANLWEEEIFGPILPIMAYTDINEAISFVNSKPKPLALYVFTTEKKLRNLILDFTSSGGVCVNDCAIHFLHHNLPFGGVNNSGIGRSHGHFGFLTFSHEKPILMQRSGLTTIKPFYPPYTNLKKKLMGWFLKLF